ncbi:hypothetical protein [Limnobacter sp. UBA1615]|nr:hypothetical protein [Limnobacter sp. UBA1615]
MPPTVRVDEISIGIGAIMSTTLKVTHRPSAAPKTHQKVRHAVPVKRVNSNATA